MIRNLMKDVDLDTMYSMRRDGMNNQAIADALGVTSQTVCTGTSASSRRSCGPLIGGHPLHRFHSARRRFLSVWRLQIARLCCAAHIWSMIWI